MPDNFISLHKWLYNLIYCFYPTRMILSFQQYMKSVGTLQMLSSRVLSLKNLIVIMFQQDIGERSWYLVTCVDGKSVCLYVSVRTRECYI